MSDIETLLPDTADNERIRQWREDRHRVAESEKAERLRLREEKRIKEASDREEQRARELAELMPTKTDLEATKARIRKNNRAARVGFWFQFFAICVAPIAAAAWYLASVATPLYEAKSVIAVTTPGGITEPSNSGILGALNGPSHLQDVFMAHSYIQSQALMEDLEADHGLVTTLSSDAIDPVQRLRDMPDFSQDKRAQFSRFVNSSVDIQTGLLTVYVRAADDETSVAISETVLDRVATQVRNLNTDAIDQRLTLASQAVSDAQDQIGAAQTALMEIQLQSSEGDPAERIAGIYIQIGQLETEAMALSHDIQKSEIMGQEGSFQMQRAVALYDRLEGEIEAQRALLRSEGQNGQPSLNALLMAHQLAELEVEIAQEALSTALAAKAEATQKAAMARSLFQVVVPPRTAAHPMVPNAPRILLLVLVGSLATFALIRVTRAGRQMI